MCHSLIKQIQWEVHTDEISSLAIFVFFMRTSQSGKAQTPQQWNVQKSKLDFAKFLYIYFRIKLIIKLIADNVREYSIQNAIENYWQTSSQSVV